jgi:uncharacterized protein YegL
MSLPTRPCRPPLPTALLLSLALAACNGSKSEDDDKANDQPAADAVECIAIDRFEGFTVPPAGIGLGFRLLDCDGNPLLDADGNHRQLTASQISVINDETGSDFNQSSEGGAVSEPGTPSNVRVYAMLVLDFSRSIFENGNEAAVVDGALRFIDATLVNNDSELTYEVAIIAFGGPDQTAMIADFTSDPTELQQALSAAIAEGSHGTTDLYGAYMMGLEQLSAQGSSAEANGELVERVAVIWSDGAHEAGNADELRSQAIDAKADFEGSPFTIYVQGEDTVEQTLCELAKNDDSCFAVQEASELEGVFTTISERAQAIARSNYVVGVCTPVALGEPSLQLVVTVDGVEAREQAWYPTDALTGDVDSCNEDDVKSYYQEYLQGGGGGVGGDDGGGGDDGSGGDERNWRVFCDEDLDTGDSRSAQLDCTLPSTLGTDDLWAECDLSRTFPTEEVVDLLITDEGDGLRRAYVDWAESDRMFQTSMVLMPNDSEGTEWVGSCDVDSEISGNPYYWNDGDAHMYRYGR